MNKKAKVFLAIALILCLISSIGTCLVQTSGGRVDMKEIKFMTTFGKEMNAYLLIPENATPETPAPAVVVSHGFLNNKEMQDLNYVELARRGFVVLAINLISHGDSEISDNMGELYQGVYQAVLFIKDLDCVDKAKIGVTGHSFGAANCNMACQLDNMNETRLIAAALPNSSDPTYKDDSGEFANIYGSRDVGVIAGQYDEFGFVTMKEDGTPRPKPEYIHSAEAQSFLNFGTYDPSAPEREANTMYRETIDGEEAIRVIYNPSIIHPWSHFCKRSTTATIEFFDAALGAPHPIPASNQVWQWKVCFNVIGLVGFFMFVVNCAILLVQTKPFAELAADEPVQPRKAPGKKGKTWFFISLILSAIWGAATYLPILNAMDGMTMAPTIFGQNGVFAISVWAAGCGLFSLLCMFISQKIAGDEKIDLREAGALIGGKKLLKTILLAITVSAASYAIVFLAHYFFLADFRIWVLAVRPFNSRIFIIAIPFMIILCVFYILNSIAVNCFNYNEIGGKGNLAILACFNALSVVIVIAL